MTDVVKKFNYPGFNTPGEFMTIPQGACGLNVDRAAFVVDPLGFPMNIEGINTAKDRTGLIEHFEKAPQLTGVTQLPAGDSYDTSDLLLSLNANRYFEVLGTNAVSADVAQYAEGGITVATHGATNDSTIILPHLTATQSPWTKWTWGTDRSVRWGCAIQTPAAVTSLAIWAGLKLTNTPTVATDNDQVMFKFNTAHSTSPTYWHTVYSISGTDVDTAITELPVVAAATKYNLLINIDSRRVASFYINGQYVGASTALAAVDLIPYIGILDLSAGSARTMVVYHEEISRLTGA